MPIQSLLQQIAWLTTTISLIATAIFALTFAIGSLLRGAPVPFREWKEFGQGLTIDAIKAAFMLALWTSIASLITWIVSVIASAQ